MMESDENAQIQKDLQRWQVRKDKSIPKSKYHVYDVMTKHALQRAEQRNMRVKDVVEGRAKVKQILTKEKRYITIIPDTKTTCKPQSIKTPEGMNQA